ncbi:hypothetical protein [Paludibacter sp. 221]|uniref:hypothetical protein n=1 Tax=Paludibacter sp. 221 TaxID=2302939 RepID=UPI0013D3DB60|nr:hypothetical protein [Paludibacter sp. 221]
MKKLNNFGMKKRNLLILMILVGTNINAAIFIKTDKGYIKQTEELKGSLNNILKTLGYESNMYYTYSNSEKESDIRLVCFKNLTTDIICVFTENNVLDVREQEVKVYLSNFDFSNVYSTYSREEDLKEGIERKNLSIEFLAEALKIPYNINSKDTMLICNNFKYNLYFKEGYLCKFESSDGYNSSAKEFMEQNPDYFKIMKLFAQEYWGKDEEQIKNELNVQCEALYNIPDGFENEYLDRFSLKYGCYNFKIVSVLYYKDKITLREFKDICHSNVKFISTEIIEEQELYVYEYKNAFFAFLNDGTLATAVP